MGDFDCKPHPAKPEENRGNVKDIDDKPRSSGSAAEFKAWFSDSTQIT
jgi:hypothetical protein